MNELQVEYRPVADLIPYANNSRTHSDEQVAQVAASIKEFGFTNPVLVDEDNGIIAGHGRVMAAQKLKLEQVPTITLAGLTEAQRKAYVIADNKIALNSEWDEQLLIGEIERLQELDFDLSITGFDADELLDLLDDIDLDDDEEVEHDTVYDEDKFLLLVEYDNESQLEQAYNEAMTKGLKCKIIE